MRFHFVRSFLLFCLNFGCYVFVGGNQFGVNGDFEIERDVEMNLEFEEIVPVVSSGSKPGEPVDIANVVRVHFVVEFKFLFCCRV